MRDAGLRQIGDQMKAWKLVIAVAVLLLAGCRTAELYKDSANLHYDGKTIHSNYNGWIQNPDKAIRTQLDML